jgi:hypothetical protein
MHHKWHLIRLYEQQSIPPLKGKEEEAEGRRNVAGRRG